MPHPAPRVRHAHVALLASVAVLAGGALEAGTVSLAWDAVSHPDLVGYRVHYGTAPGQLDGALDVGLVTTATVPALADCTTWYVGVTARGSDGAQSPEMSQLVSGWPRPTVAAAAPATLDRGATVAVQLDGTNFAAGATVDFGAGITVDSLTAAGCQQLVATVTVAAGAALGPRAVAVTNPDQVFGDAPALVTVVVADDGVPPVLSTPQASGVTGTAATIAWTTDEPTDARVAYRPLGAAVWLDGPSDPGPATSHAVTLTGLVPETTYEYRASSADEAGNEATSGVATFTTAASAFDYLRFEPEAVPLPAPAAAMTGAGAFRGGWLELEPGTPKGSPTAPAGEFDLGVMLPRAATWHVWIRMYGASGAVDTWLETVDGASYQFAHPDIYGVWEWVPARSWALAAGQHTVTLGGYETGARVDRVLVTDDPDFVPTEAPGADVTPPPPALLASATPGDAAVTLAWTDPTAADAARVVVRARSDGAIPVSPVDGESLLDAPVDPGATLQLLHDGLANGAPVGYAIFVLDAAGNASDAVPLSATPQAPPPELGTVQNVRRTDRIGG